MSDKAAIATALGFSFLLGFCLAGMCFSTIIEQLHAEAVKRGAAHWKVDAATGKTEFEWNMAEADRHP